MVKRAVTKVKKETKVKQKQRQQQNVTVNIGTVEKKPRAKRQPKAKAQAQAQPSPIVTRGPTTFYQQPQPSVTQTLAQPTINELFKMIQQSQSQAQAPQAQTSIVPPPQVEVVPKEENDLERIRKSRIKAVEKPELERVFEEQNDDVDLEDKAYERINKPFRPLRQFYEQQQQERQISLLKEPDPVPSIDLNPWENIAPDTERPSLSLQESSLFAPPRSILRRDETVTTDDVDNLKFVDLFSNSPSLEPQGAARSLVSTVAATNEVVPPINIDFEPFEEGEAGPADEELPKIIQPPADDTPLVQLLNPSNDPSLAEAVATEVRAPDQYRNEGIPREEDISLRLMANPISEATLAAAEVRAPDQYVTEQLVKDKGLPDAEARVVDTRLPKERLKEFAVSLGVDISAGKSGARLTSDEIKARIYKKMGDDYEIPSFKEASVKPGPKKAKPAIAENIDV